jgi:hypothetical protein
MNFARIPFFILVLLIGIVAFPFTQASLAGCASLAEVKKIEFQPYNTGILTRSSDGKIVFTFGTVFDSHSTLVTHATQNYGVVTEILWAGELKAGKNKIQIINETAGIMIRNTPAIQSKTSDLNNLVVLYERYPKLRRLFASKPTLIPFDSTLEKSKIHLFTGLEDISRFRHDIQGTIATFTSLAEGAEAGFLTLETITSLNDPLKKRASEMLQLISIAEKFNYGSINPGDPNRENLKRALQGVEEEGFGPHQDLTLQRLNTIANGAKFLVHEETGIFSIFIE